MNTVEDELRQARDFALQSLHRDHSMMPHVALTLKDGRRAMVPAKAAGSPDYNEKETFSRLLRGIVYAAQVEKVTFMSEAWMAKEFVDDNRAPRDRPDRTEIIYITTEWRDGRRGSYFGEIVRDPLGKFLELKDNGYETNVDAKGQDFEGRYTNWFECPPMPDHIRESFLALFAEFRDENADTN